MDNNLIEVKNDFKRQFETVQEEIVDLERELNKKEGTFSETSRWIGNPFHLGTEDVHIDKYR